MKLGDGYWLVWPAFPVEYDDHIVIFTVGSLLALRDQDDDLAGHPIRDLPDEHKGWLPVTRAKRARIERWYEDGRLLKIKRNAGGSYYITFCEAKKYKALLTDEDLHWLRMITEAANQFTDELLAERKRGLEVVTADPVAVKAENRKARRKERKQARLKERAENVR